jgi:uridine nucleosidase
MACPPKSAWLITTGPLTNCALLLAVFPDLVPHLGGLSVMGGAIGSKFTEARLGNPFCNAAGQEEDRIGNHTPYAEFNVWCDPESARSVFGHAQLSKKTTLIPLDVTHQVFATQAELDLVLHGRLEGQASCRADAEPSRLRRILFELLTFFAKTYSDVFGLTEGPPLHDPLAVAVVLADVGEDLGVGFDDRGGERFRVDVEVTGEQCGRTSVQPSVEGVRIPRTLDHAKFWRVLNDCVEQADRRR